MVLAGLSFIRLPLVPEPEEATPVTDESAGNLLRAFRVFRNLRSHPHWVGAFVIIGLLTAIYSFAFTKRITPERIVDHTMEKVAEMGPPFAPPPDRIEAMRAEQLSSLKNPLEQVGNVIKSFAGLFAFGAFVAALSMLGVLVFGGRINFWQAMAVTFYASLPIVVIQKLLGLVVLYLKSPEDLHPILNAQTTVQDNLGVLIIAGLKSGAVCVVEFHRDHDALQRLVASEGIAPRSDEGKQRCWLGCFDYVDGLVDDLRGDLDGAVPAVHLVAVL